MRGPLLLSWPVKFLRQNNFQSSTRHLTARPANLDFALDCNRLKKGDVSKLENLIQRVLEPTRLDIEIRHRFGNPFRPRKWFLVPLLVIDEAVERIKHGTITDYVDDADQAKLVHRITLVSLLCNGLLSTKAASTPKPHTVSCDKH